ncbi:MAG: FAD-dependent oxidoreductase [Gammaproteobacteria bacterium]|nr:FAD-dependent oxidoreductase [Gammaproteobacteria bacterium]
MATCYDIAIIGAGPAGCAAAISACCAGLTVCIIEQSPFPRHRPGESLSPGVAVLFTQLGVADKIAQLNALRYRGISLCHSDGEITFQPFGQSDGAAWQGYQIRREQLDQILLERAQSVGVVTLLPEKAVDLMIDEKNPRVQIHTLNSQTVSANYCIDATGPWGLLARKLPLTNQYDRRLIASYVYIKGDYQPAYEHPIFYLAGLNWLWVARIDEQHYQWTALQAKTAFVKKINPPEQLDKLMPLGKISHADVSWRYCHAAAGHGYFLVGDAACALDPGSSHGVLKALLSGIKAAYLITQVIGKNLDQDNAMTLYRRWIADGYYYDKRQLSKHYQLATADVQQG